MNSHDQNVFSFRLLRKNKPAMISFYVLLFFALIALLAPLLANDKPLYVKYQGTILFPAFASEGYAEIESGNKKMIRLVYNQVDWKNMKDAEMIFPPVPWHPNRSDMFNYDYVGPGDYQADKSGELKEKDRHLLGTGKRGEDVLSGLIHGTRVSMSVGILSMVIASLIGVFLGAVAGYFGDDKLQMQRGTLLMLVLALIPAWFFGFTTRTYILHDALNASPVQFTFQMVISFLISTGIIIFFYLAGKLLSRSHFLNPHVNFPVDSLVSRLTEVLISLPRLILIISIAAIARPSLLNLIIIIGLTSWTDIARFTRAEMLRVRNLDYIQSARAMGFSELRVIFRHALPNAIAPALVTIAFGIASAILIESGLSFLGIGVPQDIVTWGSLLASGKENFNAWWLVVFPGLAIFITVTAYNLIGEGIRDVLDPKTR
jgi:peptide/nickel transport system permease protein